jgi:hypothetical protein
MSTKTAKHFLRNYNWKQVNNMICYDVIFPERLSKRQQILRLYKNTLRKVYEKEFFGSKLMDITGYAEGVRDVREDFEVLKTAKTEEEVNTVLDKYEYFIELNFNTGPLNRDNVPYEWRHEKGMIHVSDSFLAADPHGYYSQDKENYYPKPREFEFRGEFPMSPLESNYDEYNFNGWDDIDINNTAVEGQGDASAPDSFKMEVEELKKKYSSEIDLWEKNQANH